MQDEFGDELIHFENHHADPLAIPETTARGTFYGVGGHPHVVIDGLYAQLGATSCPTAANGYRDKIEQRRTETGAMSPVAITGGFTRSAGQIQVSTLFRLIDPVNLVDLRASILVYENNVLYCCGYGGVDTWQRVTRRIVDQTISLTTPGDSTPVNTTIAVDPAWNPDELVIVAYLQRTTGNREIYQGYRLPELPAGTEETPPLVGRSGIRSLGPNPVRSSIEIAFGISEGAAAEPIQLAIHDLLGRRVSVLAEGKVGAGEHRLRWDGLDARGTRLASGIYFARLLTADGTASRRIVLLQ